MGNRQCQKRVLFSEDLAEICLLILENDNFDIDPIINVGSGEEISIKKLSKEIAKLTKYDGKIIWDKTKPNGVSRKLLCSKRAKKIGWKSNTSLADGIKKTYDWYLKNNELF